MIKIILFLVIFSSSVFGQKIPKPKLIKGTTPVEFEMVFNFVRKNLKVKERIKFLELAHKLDGHFKLLPKENLFFFLKSEVYRNIIQYEFDTYVQRIDVNPILLEKLKQKMQMAKILYEKFPRWVLNSVIADLEPYLHTKVFKNLGTIGEKNTADDKELAGEIERKIRYLQKWFYVAEKYDPDEFNEMMLEVGWTILKNINDYAQIMAFHTGKLSIIEPVKFFELPPLPDAKTIALLDKVQTTPDYKELDDIEKKALKAEADAKALMNKIGAPVDPNAPQAQPLPMQDPNLPPGGDQYPPGPMAGPGMPPMPGGPGMLPGLDQYAPGPGPGGPMGLGPGGPMGPDQGGYQEFDPNNIHMMPSDQNMNDPNAGALPFDMGGPNEGDLPYDQGGQGQWMPGEYDQLPPDQGGGQYPAQ